MTRPTRAISRCVAVTLLCAACYAWADDPPNNDPADNAKNGGKNSSFTLSFSNRSELSGSQYVAQRMGWPLMTEKRAEIDYNLPDESFEVYVPEDYTGDKPYGLLVFVMPHPGGKPPQNYLDAIDKHHLIWVCPNNAGNGRYVGPRMGLAIDAAVNMQSRYKIDPQRIYVSGISGGGRVASMLGVGYADVFKGGIYIIGCNTYRQEFTADKRVYQRSYNVPPPKIFKTARKCKHVFITGDNDPNREQTDLNFKGFKHDGFDHILYFQVPGMGHQPPSAEWFEKALAFLDEPVPAAAAGGATTRPVGPAKRPLAKTATTRPAVVPPPQPDDRAGLAAKLMKNAQLYVDNRQYELAREKLRWIVEKFGDTPAAVEAKKTLEAIAGK